MGKLPMIHPVGLVDSLAPSVLMTSQTPRITSYHHQRALRPASPSFRPSKTEPKNRMLPIMVAPSTRPGTLATRRKIVFS